MKKEPSKALKSGCIVDSTDPKDDSTILIPSFITKQMILDLVEMIEKDDMAMECAHLGKLVIRTFHSHTCLTF